jgi:hypothetical protein
MKFKIKYIRNILKIKLLVIFKKFIKNNCFGHFNVIMLNIFKINDLKN